MTLDEFCARKLFSKGSNSKCYLIGKNRDRVLKIFNTSKNIESVDKFKYFLEYGNDSFIFPHEFIIYDNKFLGYVTTRVDGEELQKKSNDIDFIAFSKLSQKLEKDIEQISKGKIIIKDLSIRNLLCSEDSLKVIDPDFYIISSENSFDKVLNANKEIYKICITDLFILPYLMLKKQPDKYVVDKINNYIKSDINVSELIINLKNDIENYYNSEISNLKQFNKVLRR